jgi:serine/threonine-protein kinase
MDSSLFGKSNLIILSTLIAIILVSILSGSTNTITTTSTTISKQQALAQTNDDNSTFKTYENPAYGIRVQYPSDWEKVEPGQISQEISFIIIVGFVSPKESVSDTSPPAALSIGIHNLSSSSSYQNTTLDQYTDVHVNAIRREQESLIESTTTTLSASNNNTLAHKVVYVNNQGQEVIQVWTIKENKAYHITYAADVARYPDFLPLAQKIIDSFEIGTISIQEVQPPPPPTV